MPELRSQPVIRASVADYRPLTTGSGDGRNGHHKGVPGQSDNRPVLRARRNGLPVTRPYQYGHSSYQWAVRALRAAEAEHGTPPGTRGPKPRKNRLTTGERDTIRAAGAQDGRRSRAEQGLPGSPPDERCPACGYPLDSIGHETECGGAR